MAHSAQSARTSFESREKLQDTPFTSTAPSLYNPADIEAAQPGIPDGGFAAWLQVACGFFLFFNSWGLINAFGVWQSYYTTTLLPSSSNSAVSWIGSIEAFLLCCCTIFAGPLFDRGYVRLLVWTGSFLVVFGLMMTSLCNQYWQIMLAQGLCMGIGAGGLFITSVAIIPQYFTTKRAFAIGIAASGSSLGGVIYPIVFYRLQPQLGFGWATRVVGFMALGTLLLPCICIRVRSLPATPRKQLVDFSGFRELPFCLFCLAAFVGFIGLYVPFFYISEFGATQGGLNENLAFYMLPILSSGSIVGRILPSYIADHLGPLNVLTICNIIAGILGFIWIAVHNSLGGLVIWALLYGAFSGAFVSLQPSTVVSITDDMSVVGGRLGMNTFCAALGILIGNPVAGVIVAQGWIGLQSFCGGTLLAGAVLVGLTRWSRVGWSLSQKA
ncbi:hypothetical protein BAUCODRAFT_137947 [Baudoinia panamericana UAMH 10762]|uniref:Major facilitator superfamily (MFS) profile domain-containing protein n=1 Tax=Baudoinia panamericana (strain UAMH 10762) TaxID=717646 RepID=M2LUC2_BAUPA|nr:uncharacterized protein BAUCODRAFT_137947 [Baudoinia panamericana UAMH 10762]EMC98162.1 hypothetical protein BAUCODRAFT_137947 [Baudoinia panamericana UAMH 10762]